MPRIMHPFSNLEKKANKKPARKRRDTRLQGKQTQSGRFKADQDREVLTEGDAQTKQPGRKNRDPSKPTARMPGPPEAVARFPRKGGRA